MERLRSILSFKKTHEFCKEPPEPGITYWVEADPANPGLSTICRTPEEKARVYQEAVAYADDFYSNLRIVYDPPKPKGWKEPEYSI